MMDCEFRIVPERGYCCVYINGDFYCTADNYLEAAHEIEEYKREREGSRHEH